MKKQPVSDPFCKAYKQLNKEQKQAVDNTEGPVMVLAGPGTGKTQVLTTRIAKILQKTDLDASAILALTFTESGALAMRQRLLEMVGVLAYRVNIFTFHGFCAEIIRRYPEEFTVSPNPQPLTDLERFRLVKTILSRHPFPLLRPINAPDLYLRTIISSLQTLKREGVTPPDLKRIIANLKAKYSKLVEAKANKEKVTKKALDDLKKQTEKLSELMEIYYFYQKEILDLRRLDFEDLINGVTLALRQDGGFLLTLQEQYQYLLVDEFQDTNNAQLNLVWLLSSFWGSEANLFVVGDPNQSIYRFQGASAENVARYIERFPKARVISLEDNYRSNQGILDAAYQLISFNEDLFEKKYHTHLKATAGRASRLKSVEFSDSLLEQNYLGEKIKALLRRGVRPSEIAILARRNSDLAELRKSLDTYKIPYRSSGGNLLEEPELKQLVVLLSLIRDLAIGKEDPVSLFAFLSLPFLKLNTLDLLRLNRAANEQKTTVFKLYLGNLIPSLKIRSAKKITKLFSRLASWSQLSANTSLPTLIEQVVNESGFLANLESLDNAIEKLTNLKGFLDLAIWFSISDKEIRLDDFLEQLELLATNNLEIERPDLNLSGEEVSILTAHKAKGLEWDYCFLYKAVDGVWGNNRVRELIKLPEEIVRQKTKTTRASENEEERRLFYVALTRARKEVIITSSRTYHVNLTNKQSLSSMFLAEIGKNHLHSKNEQLSKTKTLQILEKQVKPTTPVVALSEKQYLRKLVTDFPLSASALVMYLECPYKFKLKYLVRIPEIQNPAMLYGLAIHQTLEQFGKQTIKGEKISLPKLLVTYRNILMNSSLAQDEIKPRLKHGKAVLKAYFAMHQGIFPKPLFIEKWFGGKQSPIFLDGKIPLNGKVDRIDLIDVKRKLIRVVDYKTGQPKTLGQVKGETADSDGRALKQLLFYKLITEQDDHFDYHITELELDYIEGPFLENRYKKIVITPSDQELKVLKEEIVETYKRIQHLDFARTTNYQVCANCPLKLHCWPEGVPEIER